MQGNDNFIPIYKRKNKDGVRLDKKRDKKRPKDEWKKQRKLKIKEIEE